MLGRKKKKELRNCNQENNITVVKTGDKKKEIIQFAIICMKSNEVKRKSPQKQRKSCLRGDPFAT